MTACGQCQGSECSNAMANHESSDYRDANDHDNDSEDSENDGYKNIFEELLDF